MCLLAIALLETGCASRLPASSNRLSTAQPVGFEGEVRLSFDSAEAFRRHSEHLLRQAQKSSKNGKVNFLVLSGGGAGGAFGAGALLGLSHSGHRPTFEVVTGVSTGALIAPLAFLGPDWDPVLARAFSGDTSANLLQRSFLGMLFGSSLYRGQPLRDTVDSFVTDELIVAVARESRRGRKLFVETTDLDKSEPVIWNMGVIAEHGGSAARELFRDVLVASASIPFVFPPVMIRVTEDGQLYDEMHVDGGTTLELFLGPPVGVLVKRDAPRAKDVNVFVIANTQFGRFPSTTPLGSKSLLLHGFDTTLDHSIRSAMLIAISIAQNYGMKFNMTFIPESYTYGGPLDFDPEHMHALFELGKRCAAAGQLWGIPADVYHRSMMARAPSPGTQVECPAAP